MYCIYADGVCIYNDIYSLDNMRVVNPKLVLEDNSAGTLTMTLPSSNIGYSTIIPLVTNISVTKDNGEIWAGRVLSESRDFWNNRVLCCEGELAFFNDSTQPPAEYHGLTVRGFLERLLEIHNGKVGKDRQFQIGAVTVHDSNESNYRCTNNEKTIECINEKLLKPLGGHLRIRKANGLRYLDYLADLPTTSSQTIQFGVNLLDFTRKWDWTEFATVVMPLGPRLDDSPFEDLDAYLTVESENGGSPYVQSSEAVTSYGWIEKVISWDDVGTASALLTKARAYLSDLQFDNMEIELSALDLHYLNADIDAVKLLDEIRVVSRPHGMDRLFPVTKLEIPLDSPEKTQFTLGSTIKSSLTNVNNQISSSIMQKIDALPKRHSILKEAKENATEIMNLATTGYITITKDQYGSDTLYISNLRDYTKANKLWKWNMNGLGYSKDGGKTFGLAITMDGAIVADFITTGTLNADVIRAGVLKDNGSNFSLDFKTGKLTMKKGSINIGDNFIVDEAGNVTARKGTFYGNLSGVKGTFSGVVQAEDFLDKYGRSMMDGDAFSSEYLDLYGLTIRNKTYKNVTFHVDESGNVFINGQVTMGEGSFIDWSGVTNANLSSNPAWSKANSAQNDADLLYEDLNSLWNVVADMDVSLPDYIHNTYIDSVQIRSPVLTGNQIIARQYFTLAPNDNVAYGYMGLANGIDAGGRTTYGVAISSGPPDGLSGSDCYVIVTNAGVRLQARGHSLTLTSTGCWIDGHNITP